MIHDSDDDFMVKDTGPVHVPAWFSEMNSKITKFVDQNDQLEATFVSNNQKIQEFNKLEKQEKRRVLFDKYGEKTKKHKLADLNIMILLKIVQFAGDMSQTIRNLCRCRKRLANQFMGNVKIWKLVAESYIPLKLVTLNPKINNWRNILKYIFTSFKTTLESLETYRSHKCPAIVNKVMS